MKSLFVCASVPKAPKSVQTVKLTLYHRTEILRARHTGRSIHRNETKPPAYLFRYTIMSKSQRPNETGCALSCGAPAPSTSKMSPRFRAPGPRPASRQHIPAPPVRGYLGIAPRGRKDFFCGTGHFLDHVSIRTGTGPGAQGSPCRRARARINRTRATARPERYSETSGIFSRYRSSAPSFSVPSAL